MPLEEAWKLAAKIVAAFLALHLCPQVCACVWMDACVSYVLGRFIHTCTHTQSSSI